MKASACCCCVLGVLQSTWQVVSCMILWEVRTWWLCCMLLGQWHHSKFLHLYGLIVTSCQVYCSHSLGVGGCSDVRWVFLV